MDTPLARPIMSGLHALARLTIVNHVLGRLQLPSYDAWSNMLLTEDAADVLAVHIVAARLENWLVPSLLLRFDTLFPNVAASFKVTGATSPPARPLRLLSLSAFNMVLLTAVELALAYGFEYATGTPIFPASATPPPVWKVITHVVILMAARDVLTYYIHRFLLHDKNRSPRLTDLHARWAHADADSGGHPDADHPLLLLVLHLAPALLPSLALQPHLTTYILFTCIYTHESIYTNSGYTLLPDFVYGEMTRRAAAAHYVNGGRTCFGTWGVLDWVHGTTGGDYVQEDVKDEAEEHDDKVVADEHDDKDEAEKQDDKDWSDEGRGMPDGGVEQPTGVKRD